MCKAREKDSKHNMELDHLKESWRREKAEYINSVDEMLKKASHEKYQAMDRQYNFIFYDHSVCFIHVYCFYTK